MTIILPRHKTAAENIGSAFRQGLEKGVEEGNQESLERKKEERKRLFELQERKTIADFLKKEYNLEGTENLPSKFSTEILKSKEKGRAQEQKQNQLNSFLKNLNLDNEEEEPSPLNQPSQNRQPSEFEEEGNVEIPKESEKKTKRKLIPENVIAQAAAVNPAVADKLQKHNDNIIAQERHDENMAFKKAAGQTKEVRESYHENQPFINKTYDQYEDSLRKEAITDRMDQLEESGELSDSGIINLLESLGMKAEWLKNPANEEYNKLGLDLLGGGTLQADYGSRVLASEFKVSQQRIPTLSQTPEGRKQIKENIRTMLLPSKLKHERMQYYLDRAERTGEALPHNLRGRILKDIQPQLEEAYDKFKERNGRYKVKEGTFPDDNAIEKYYYLSDGNEDKAMKLMAEDGYDIKPKRNGGVLEKSGKRTRISSKFQ